MDPHRIGHYSQIRMTYPGMRSEELNQPAREKRRLYRIQIDQDLPRSRFRHVQFYDFGRNFPRLVIDGSLLFLRNLDLRCISVRAHGESFASEM